MRNYNDEGDIDRQCNNCGAADWTVFVEDEYGGERNKNIQKTQLYCNVCDREGKLFEENGHETWTGNLR